MQACDLLFIPRAIRRSRIMLGKEMSCQGCRFCDRILRIRRCSGDRMKEQEAGAGTGVVVEVGWG